MEWNDSSAVSYWKAKGKPREALERAANQLVKKWWSLLALVQILWCVYSVANTQQMRTGSLRDLIQLLDQLREAFTRRLCRIQWLSTINMLRSKVRKVLREHLADYPLLEPNKDTWVFLWYRIMPDVGAEHHCKTWPFYCVPTKR